MLSSLSLIAHGWFSWLLWCSSRIWSRIISTLTHNKSILWKPLHIDLMMSSSNNLINTALSFHLNLRQLFLQLHLLLLLWWKIMSTLRIIIRIWSLVSLHSTVLTSNHDVLIWIFTTEKASLGMSLSCIIDSSFWSWAFRFCKVHDVFEVAILDVVSVKLLLNYCLLKLHLLLLSGQHFLLFICQNWVFWSLLLFLSSLCWTHDSSNKLISTYHAHAFYFLMTFCWWALHRICDWPWIIVSWFCATSDIVGLNNIRVLFAKCIGLHFIFLPFECSHWFQSQQLKHHFILIDIRVWSGQ